MASDLRITAERASGILLHPTSLPDADGDPASGSRGPTLRSPGSGDFGASARHFVDWLVAAGQRRWQVLPLGPVGPGNSPYMSPSAFALNPLLVDPEDLVARGWLEPPEAAAAAAAAVGPGTAGAGTAGNSAAKSDPDAGGPRIDQPAVTRFRMACLAAAARRFLADRGTDPDFEGFLAAEAAWLDDYAAFMTIEQRHPGRTWHGWPAALAAREPSALAKLREEAAEEIRFWQFVQWIAHRQWLAVKRHANERGVRIVGDLPIFVALHSADVWANPGLFHLDDDLRPRVVAGVPPDYFSATGQLWGNPLYRWDRHRDLGYDWWLRRVRAALAVTDMVRIDHFRGFAAYWEVPADAPDAIGGRWVAGPGTDFFDAVAAALGAPVGGLPIIAEDLGLVTPDVIALREAVGLPGMRVLQFAFGDDSRNLYLPHNYSRDTVVYTGTHDNDTSIGWFATAPEAVRRSAQVYLGVDGREINWDLVQTASRSVADLAIYPLQDILGLGSEARMNRPGDADGCWGWRFRWDQVAPWQAERLASITRAHGRAEPPR
jgi:4-alpha-glucanotransferase